MTPRMTGSLGAADATLEIDTLQLSGAGIQITGTWTGTISFEVSLDNINWVAVNAYPSNSSTAATGATANGIWTLSVAGIWRLRVRMSSYTSGTASITMHTTDSAPSGSSTGGGGGGSGDGSILDGSNPLIKASVLNLASNDPLAVALVDGTGAHITSVGGGTQYTEGDVDTSITGTAMLAEAASNTLQPLQLDASNNLKVVAAVPTSGGCSRSHLVSAGSTNATSVKASAGQLYGVHVYNNAAYPVYVKFHNTAGAPTAGSGVVLTVAAQAGQRADVDWPQGLEFATGIAFTIVKDIADAGTTAVLASDCVVDIAYK